jgi:SAM-dependent methyltransferase
MGKNTKSPFDDGELYDVIFDDLDFDKNFYLDLAGKARGPVLEVACGTGRILLPCLQQGVDIDGLDLYPAMLSRLKRKAKGLGLKPRLYRADMRSFTLPRRYALIFIAFNGFVHSLTTGDQVKTLRACRKHLRPNGELVLTTFFPGMEVLNGPQGVPVLEREARHPLTGLPVRIYDTRTLDRVTQIQHSVIEIQELDAEGRIAVSHRSETDMRWTFKFEMELLLRAAGFKRWQIHGGFDGRPLTLETDLMLTCAEK